MRDIHTSCVNGSDGEYRLCKRANVAGFVKVADAMLDQGGLSINKNDRKREVYLPFLFT